VTTDQKAFLVLAANTSWVFALAEALAAKHSVHSVRFYDWLNYWRLRPEWPTEDPVRKVTKSLCLFPPGYAGRLEIVARPLIRQMVNVWRNQSRLATGQDPFVICPYPFLAPWVRSVPNNKLIYYNLDEYTLYRPSRANQIRSHESEIISRAFRVLCLSRYQTQALRTRYPETSNKITHFPLGVHESFLLSNPSSSPVPNTVGYVGNLTDRVDWRFVADVVKGCPDTKFIFVGAADSERKRYPQWRETRADVLARANVQHIGSVKQEDVARYYWSFAVNWMPYDVLHPFNVASCPTKIMDGLASGRPFLSTGIPETELYPGRIHIARSAAEAIELINGLLQGGVPHDLQAQLTFATGHTWSDRADELAHLLWESALPPYTAR
jgi:teichuronic acid biosynthesis glycosyltransferase TuaH